MCLGAGFIHCSTGRVKIPNLGYNIVPLSFSVIYKPDQKNIDVRKNLNFPESKKVRFNIRASIGLQEMYGTE